MAPSAGSERDDRMPYNRIMDCPICKQEMKKVRGDISHNPDENNKAYDRTVYQCTADDVWVTTEIPKSLE